MTRDAFGCRGRVAAALLALVAAAPAGLSVHAEAPRAAATSPPKSKLMRSRASCAAPTGPFHMVWISGWNENDIGYASSRDPWEDVSAKMHFPEEGPQRIRHGAVIEVPIGIVARLEPALRAGARFGMDDVPPRPGRE